jgi:hypothetical protein
VTDVGVGIAVASNWIALAAEDAESGIITKDTVSPGGVGFFLFLALGLGTFFLWRSMTRQLKRIDFDESAASDTPVVDVTDSNAPGRGVVPPRENSVETDPES